ncbi:hypothetical protein C3L50_12775 [Flavobacterium alvei]|uniref:Secretion system C-terminal sorting domain-containing protein n=1 Tax=Flavobacterium alvei TaxID=2080416 RepID=A0A2S5A6D3_9FLAO|nr:T9SS sorting signal type C domain-containing protein [Flavobacterium alvei]POY38138.1 hypothetical protein C3L50_12775 [Flavobacterium alvei]
MKQTLLKKRILSLSILVFFLGAFNVTHAQLNTWVGGTSSNFLDAANWTTAAPPATFLAANTFTIGAGTPNNPVLGSSGYPKTSGAPTSGIITITTAGNLTSSGNINVNGACNDDGQLTVNGGLFNVRNNYYVGGTAGTALAIANVEVGGTLNVKSTLAISQKQPGTVNVNGGILSTDAAGFIAVGNYKATYVNCLGILNINSGIVKVPTTNGLVIGTAGTVNIDAGKIELTGNQTAAITTYITANKIKVSGAALAAGKTISNTYNAITNLTTVTATTTIWDGSTWSNGTPDSTLEAVITGIYTTGTNGDITAKKLTVTSGSLTINSGGYVNVANEVVNNAGAGGIVIENDANLIQVNNTTNTGNAVVKRNSNPLSRLDYTLWSSPVANQNLLAFSPLTSNTSVVTTPITTVNRFYTYDSATNFYVAIPDPAFATTAFAKGTGYLIRMPNTAVAAPGTETFNGVFTGVLNNGDVNLTGLTAGQYVAVGNPYPSVISADSFIDVNSTGAGSGTLYFWRKTNNLNQSTTPTTSYATYTKAGPVGLPAGSGTANEGFTPNGTIAVGQGFITTVPTSGTIVFTNALRSSSTTAQFLRTKALAEKSRVWLNLSEGTNPVNQMMVAYMDGATTGFDSGIDGKYINDAATALTSDIAGEEYVIQGRPTFSDTDVVNLNFKASVAGTYTIAKDHVDGLFATGQDIYLVDTTTGTETNLQKEAYTFTAAAGVNNTRFQLTYKTSASLKVNDLAFDENSISVYKQNGVLNINAGNTTMKSVKVFDVTGRLVLEQKSVNATTTALKNLAAGKQALLIQITSDDNRVVTKKAIN